MNDKQAAKLARRRRTNRNILIVLGVLLAALLLCAGFGALVSPTDAAEQPPAPATEVSAAPEAPLEAKAPPVTAAPVPGTYSDPRCAPASDAVVALVADGLTEAGHSLTNGTVVEGSGVTFFGATTVEASGRMVNRSDVWVIRDGAVYASTGGARHGSIFPKVSAVLDILPNDELVQLADTCVIDLTR
ncbi:hypothetical protein [Nocardia testacea]|uniref:hypothetical protein n=1 Tax=Nocardia testacea TaxID=248551 RepID=UPI0002E6F196|nr:hypothetical protein [Nocardia testacea]